MNTLLRDISSALYINPAGTEGTKILKSVDHLTSNLNVHFGNNIRIVKKFGSFTRGTILPRNTDPESDIDLLIVFNLEDTKNVSPGSLRRHLIKFAQARYPSSISYRDQPAVVLELQHIRYDLVPAVISSYGYSWSTTYIPKDDYSWQVTNPDDFNRILTEANVRYDNIVKPIVRLLKAWNAKKDFPLQPFALEQEVAKMNFHGDNYEKGFFYAIEQLNQYGYSQNVQNKIEGLKKNADRVREALAKGNSITAKDWLTHILPIEKDW